MPRRHLIHHHLKFYYQKLDSKLSRLPFFQKKYSRLIGTKGFLALILIFFTVLIVSLLSNHSSTPKFQKAGLFSGWDYQSFNPSSNITISTRSTPKTGVIDFKYHNSSLEFELPLPGSSIKQNGQDKIEFATAQNNIVPQYQVLTNGLKENIILNQIPITNQFQSTLRVTNADIYLTAENLPVFLDPKTKQYLFHVQKPYAIDAAGHRTDAVSYTLQCTGGSCARPVSKRSLPLLGSLIKLNTSVSYTLTLKIDPQWLFDKSRVYPITIDPTVIHNTQTQFATGSLNRIKDTGLGDTAPNMETYYQELPADQYTVGLWHMNETTGTTITDASGNGNTGTLGSGSSAPSLGIPSLLNVGASFNGSTSYIDIGKSGFFGNGNFTIEAWVKQSSTQTGEIFSNYNGGAATISLRYDSTSNVISFYLRDSSSNAIALGTVGANSAPTNTWTHVAVVRNGSTALIYKNGILVESGSNTSLGSIDDGTNYRIGIRPTGATPFAGIIDEVRISNIARSAEQIKADAQRRPYGVYTSPVIDLGSTFANWTSLSWTGPGTSTGDGETLANSTGLVAKWDFNETSGYFANDSVTSGVAATTPLVGGIVADSAGIRTHTFTILGGTLAVPPGGDKSIQLFAWGAGGGGGTVGGWTYGAAGGAGGAAQGTLPVTSTNVYPVVVGGAGTPNSYNAGNISCSPGGGACASRNGSGNIYGAGSGGFSGIFLNSVIQSNSLLIAGGGGGGGSSRAGTGNVGGAGGGPTAGQDGTSAYDGKTAYAGKAGTQSAAGADATSDSANTTGGQGALQGGSSRTNAYGGAGGGGYWGGSGGGYSESNTMAGGGGGSSYYNPTYVSSATLTAGSYTTPGDSGNALRGTAGNAGAVAGSGANGTFIARYTYTPSGNNRGSLNNFVNLSGQDVTPGSGWTSAGRRWGTGALMFDGVDDYVNVNDNSALRLTSAGSVEAWINLAKAPTQYAAVVAKGPFQTYSDGQYAIYINSDLTARMYLAKTTGGNASVTAIAPQPLSFGKWYHLVGTWDGTTVKIYVNGVLSGSTAQTFSMVTGTSDLTIGMASDGSFFQGIIDSTRIYSRALTTSEILSNYNAANLEFQTRTSPDGINWEAWKGAVGDNQLDSLDSTDRQISSDQYHDSSSTVQQPVTNSVNTGTGADGACTVNSNTNLAVQSCSGRSTPDAVTYQVSGLTGNSATIVTGIGLSPRSPGKSCASLRLDGRTVDGIYWIDPDGPGGADPIQVYCDMTRDGGGWTLVVKNWYLYNSEFTKFTGAYGSIANVSAIGTTATIKGTPYKLDDNLVRTMIGPSQNFDVMGDQVGNNSLYSYGNFEYVLVRNYTGFWRWDKTVAASTTTTQFESHRISDNATVWTGNLLCGDVGDAGINCATLAGANPGGGSGCTMGIGSTTNSGWHHFYMHDTNSNTYLYICNGAQHSSDQSMNHRWWIRERNVVADTTPSVGLAPGDEVLITNQQGTSTNSDSVGKYEFLTVSSVNTATNDGSTSALAGRTCKSLKNGGQNASGTYWIDPDGPGGNAPFQVYCDMVTDGGGWTRVVTQIAGDVGTTNTDQKWRTALQVTQTWGPGGNILTAFFNTGAVRPNANPISITKMDPGPYGTINNMYRFSNTANSWNYSATQLFNLRNIYGYNYGNNVWWDYGADLTQKQNFCIGYNPTHQVCFYQGSNSGYAGQIYHDGAYYASGAAFEQYVREDENFSDQSTVVTFISSVKNNYGLQTPNDTAGHNQKVVLQRVPNYTNVTVTQTPTIGSAISNPGKSCSSLRLDGITTDGVYWINPDNGTPFQTYCDMTTDGGGWTFVANVAPADGNSVGYNNQDFWTRQTEYGNFTNRFSNDYKNPAAYRAAGNYLMIQSANTGANGSVLGWRRWMMDSVTTNYKTFNSFFVGGSNVSVHTTETCETGNSDNASYGSSSSWDDIIRQGNCLYADVNPSSSGEGDVIRLSTIPYNTTDNMMAGFGTCIDCGSTWQGTANPYMGLDRAGCNSSSCSYATICRDAATWTAADCLGAYCTNPTYSTAVCDKVWNSRFYVKDTYATPDAILTTSAWNGQTGGILAFRSSGTVTNNGTISMDGKGYRGGNMTLVANTNYTKGFAGERTSGLSFYGENTASGYAGGGGGGSAGGDTGGGGGGLGSDGTSGGGGGTGGLHFGQNTFDNLLLGGGGGSVGAHDTRRIGAPGGPGGGAIFIAANNLTNNSTITTDGLQGGNGTHNIVYAVGGGGGGGGGAGGNVLLQVNNLSPNLSITATGGNGGLYAPGDSGYSGGAGSLGRVAITYTGSVSGTSTPKPYIQKITTNLHQEGSNALRLNAGYLTPDTSTIALYHFDETRSGTGSTLYDYSGNGNNAIATGTSLVDGINGKARSFNGSSDYVIAPNAPSLNGTGALTIEAWINPSITAAGCIVGKWDSGQGSYYLCDTTGDKVYFGVSSTGSNAIFWVGNATISINKWNHIAATFIPSNSLNVYLNGVLDSTCSSGCTNGAVPSTVFAGNSTMNIGRRSAGDSLFTGKIDEVRISNAPRSAEEIAEDYRLGANHRFSKTINTANLSANSKLPFWVASNRLGSNLEFSIGNSGFTANEPDAATVGLWHLEEKSGSGAYLKDSSVFSNHGTPTGTTFTTGKIGNARNFNGSSDYISVANDPSLDFGSNNFTIDWWEYRTDASSTRTSMQRDYSNDGIGYAPWMAGYSDGTNLRFFASSCGKSCTWDVANSRSLGPISLNQWVYLAITRNGNNFATYKNGIQQDSWTSALTIQNGTGPLQIGRYWTGSTYSFIGNMDEVRLSNTGHSAADIRAAYEYGSRTHQVVVDFKAIPPSGIGVNSLSFNLDETPYGASSKLPHLFPGDRLIVQENVGGTEYLAQDSVSTVNPSTGAVTIASWDPGSSFPPGGFTANATVFKWQQEYFDLKGSLPSQRSTINKLTLRITDGSAGGSYWLDDFRTVSSFMNNSIGSTILSTPNRYFQYRAIESTSDSNVSTAIQSVALNYLTNYTPPVPTLTSPANNVTDQKNTVPLKMVTTDLESNPLQYKITLCTNAAMTTGCQVFDQTASQVGWSGQNTSIGTSAYNSGSTATFIPTSQLAYNTVYYWQSQAIDPTGSNLWSAASTINTFTTSYSPSIPTNIDFNPNQLPKVNFSLSATDADSDSLLYKITLCTNAAMTTGCQVFDQTASQVGWSGSGLSGALTTYSVQTPLALNATYYWESSAIDPAGTATWGPTQSYPSTFTTTPKIPYVFNGCLIEESNHDDYLRVKWTGDNNSNIGGYIVQRSVDSGAFSVGTTFGIGTSSYTDSTIVQGHTYQYRVAPFYAGPVNGSWCTTSILNLRSGDIKLDY